MNVKNSEGRFIKTPQRELNSDGEKDTVVGVSLPLRTFPKWFFLTKTGVLLFVPHRTSCNNVPKLLILGFVVLSNSIRHLESAVL